MVRSRRLELPRSFLHSDLNAARLPIPPRPHNIKTIILNNTINANIYNIIL